MIGIVISAAWSQYYASSPFKNFLDIPRNAHPDCEIIPVDPEFVNTSSFRDYVSTQCDALVVDDVYAPYMGFYDKGPKLMIDGDPHRNRPEEIPALEAKYKWADYVLTGAWPDVKLPGRFYPDQDLRDDKFVYYPHAAPGGAPPITAWSDRDGRAVLSGSCDKMVYPFRAAVREAVDSAVAVFPFQSWNHMDYFNQLSKYCGGITCQSTFIYTVAKYFEIPWCGNTLIAPRPLMGEAEMLGFVDGENVAFAANANEAIEWARMCKHLPSLAHRGRKLILDRHTIHSRLEYISRLVKAIKRGNFHPNDGYSIFRTAHIKENP